MVDRPDSFDPTTPLGTSSPRQGDDELRRIKQFTQNGWNDLTNTNRQLSGIQTHPIHTTTLNANTNGSELQNTTITNLTLTGTLTMGPFVFTVSGTGNNGVLTISKNNVNIARIESDNDVVFINNVTAEGVIS